MAESKRVIINLIGGGGTTGGGSSGGESGGGIPDYGGSSGSVYAGEVLNVPITIGPTKPVNAVQGLRDGHVWIVMEEAYASQVLSLCIDDYDKVNHGPGTLVIRVGAMDQCNVYINQNKDAGAGVYPALFHKNDSDIGTNGGRIWHISYIHQSGMNVEIDLNRPWDYARLTLKNGTSMLFPLYYFDGEQWLGPRPWDYALPRLNGTGVNGEDISYTTQKLDTNTLIRGDNLEEFNFSDIMLQIRQNNNNQNPLDKMTILDDGLIIIGDIPSGCDKFDSACLSYRKRLFAIHATRGGLEYIGKVDTRVDGCSTNWVLNNGSSVKTRYPYYVCVNKDSNELYFRRIRFNKAEKYIYFEDSNKIALTTGYNAGSAIGLWTTGGKEGWLLVSQNKNLGDYANAENFSTLGLNNQSLTYFFKFTFDEQMMHLTLEPYGQSNSSCGYNGGFRFDEVYSPAENIITFSTSGCLWNIAAVPTVKSWQSTTECGWFNPATKIYNKIRNYSTTSWNPAWGILGNIQTGLSRSANPDDGSVIDFYFNGASSNPYGATRWFMNAETKLWSVNNTGWNYTRTAWENIPDWNSKYKDPFFKQHLSGAVNEDYIFRDTCMGFQNPANPNVFLPISEKGATNCFQPLFVGSNRYIIDRNELLEW